MILYIYFVVLYYEVLCVCVCVCDYFIKRLDILFNFFFLKIDLFWWDKFSYNFKYIFINEIGFIKKIVLVVVKINKKKYSFRGWGRVSRGSKGRGWSKTKSCGEETKTSSFDPAPPHPIGIPS